MFLANPVEPAPWLKQMVNEEVVSCSYSAVV
jgi:hypothetical protein